MSEKSITNAHVASHTIFTLLCSCGAMPLVFSLPILFLGFQSDGVKHLVIAVFMLAGGSLGGFLSARRTLPATFTARYAPVVAPLVVALFLCALGYALAGGDRSSVLLAPYAISQIAFAPLLLYLSLTGDIVFILLFPLMFYVSLLATFAWCERRRADRPATPKRAVTIALCVLMALLATLTTTELLKRRYTLPQSYGMAFGGGFSSVDLWSYDVTNPENRLPRLTSPSTFTVNTLVDMPVLDGAEAAYPVYATFALACYNGIEEYKEQSKEATLDSSTASPITFTNTIYAYERLLTGEVDIFFGAQPSAEQRQMATDAGKELVLTPIGLEAFVFFVNEGNAVDGLTSDEIRAIYSGEQRNWATFGGADERIYAFQRPENSGSQTIMQRLMGNTPLAKPLKEEYVAGMGGVINRVADYRDAAGSLGYSFRFFLTGMAEPAAVKLLAVDGIAPTAESIATRTYPHTVELYAVTVSGNSKPTVAPFLTWMQSPQGQELVERIGYIPLPQ